VFSLPLCGLYGSQNKQRILPYPALTDLYCITEVQSVHFAIRTWSLHERTHFVFTGNQKESNMSLLQRYSEGIRKLCYEERAGVHVDLDTNRLGARVVHRLTHARRPLYRSPTKIVRLTINRMY
jgi:hypothetical protein